MQFTHSNNVPVVMEEEWKIVGIDEAHASIKCKINVLIIILWWTIGTRVWFTFAFIFDDLLVKWILLFGWDYVGDFLEKKTEDIHHVWCFLSYIHVSRKITKTRKEAHTDA